MQKLNEILTRIQHVQDFLAELIHLTVLVGAFLLDSDHVGFLVRPLVDQWSDLTFDDELVLNDLLDGVDDAVSRLHAFQFELCVNQLVGLEFREYLREVEDVLLDGVFLEERKSVYSQQILAVLADVSDVEVFVEYQIGRVCEPLDVIERGDKHELIAELVLEVGGLRDEGVEIEVFVLD